MRIVLTGASHGIGRHLATVLSPLHEIWGVARGESSLVILQEELGSDFRWSSGDVSSWSGVESIAKEISEVWPNVDALICCAGEVNPIGPAIETDPSLWSKTVRTNLDGTYYTIRAIFGLLNSTRERSKVICLSGGGATGPRANFTPYAVSKAGVVRLVETLAVEWAEESIDINAVAPGAISTRITQAVIDAGPNLAGQAEYMRALDQQTTVSDALDRFSGLVSYLLSSASDGISGRLISAIWDPWQDLEKHRDSLIGSDIYTLRRIVPADRGSNW